MIFSNGFDIGTSEHSFYTISNGEPVFLGVLEGTHATLDSDGAGGLISYEGQMGWYRIRKITLKNEVLIVQEIAEGGMEMDFDRYPYLEEFGYVGYDTLPMCYAPFPFLLYAYRVHDEGLY